MKLLILDNYDSFTYNLVHLVEKVSNIEFDVIQNDKIELAAVSSYDKILLSPGPGLPKDAGIMIEVIKKYGDSKDILGVCLGLQGIGESFGAKLKNINPVCHGIATPIKIITNDSIFNNCPRTFTVGRYHSWVVDEQELPEELLITAIDEQGYIMGLKHTTFNVRGVQFHPESILSTFGETILTNWLGK
ncbi:MAG: aminodeoxychorismate/anthranilate synthase component II [Bacteroidia bacterium]|jgi:anthranilate synthase component 2|nr:aminodeoxychorismate/anthranilate synthase component II [Bacteroidia bacterium]